MMRGRIVTLQRRAGRRDQGRRGRRLGPRRRPRHHLRDEVPEGSTLAAGAWWPADYRGEPLVSFEEVAAGLGLKLGDEITVNVLGRNIAAPPSPPCARRMALARHQFRDGVLAQHVRGRPAYPPRHPDLPAAARRADRGAQSCATPPSPFPAVTSVRVKDALDAVNDVVVAARAWRFAAPARIALVAAFWCSPARWPRAIGRGSTTPWC